MLRNKAARNTGLACRHNGCTTGRSSISPFCDVHRKRVERWGHPDGRALSAKRDFGVESKIVGRFLARHSEHEGVKSALQWLRQWLSDANMGEDVPGRAELQRLAAHGIEPIQILEVAAALFLLSHWSPRKLPDDARLDFQIGYHSLCLAPRNRRYSVSRGKPRMVSVTIGKVPRREVGRRIRINLAPLLMNISQALIVEEEARKKFDRDIRRAFPQ